MRLLSVAVAPRTELGDERGRGGLSRDLCGSGRQRGMNLREGFVVGWKVGHETRPDAVVLQSLNFGRRMGYLFVFPTRVISALDHFETNIELTFRCTSAGDINRL